MHVLFQDLQRTRRIIGIVKELEIALRDDAVSSQGVEVDDLLPIGRAIQHDTDWTAELAGLLQRENLEQFIEGAEANFIYTPASDKVAEADYLTERCVGSGCSDSFSSQPPR